jgi:hypothetical protein
MIHRFPGGEEQRLTDHPHADTFPRISPDGTRVVFCRSREPWVSQRNPEPWDVMLLDLATGTERRVAEFGNTPTWADDQHVVFQRHGDQIVKVALESRQEQVLWAAGRDGVPAGAALQTPSLSPIHGWLAVTLRGTSRGTWISRQPGMLEPVGGGCEITWAPDEQFLYYVDKGGRQQNAIHRRAPGNAAPELWLDLPGDFSHEYFPKLSHDGRWLAFGASQGDHEHDTADYEIFLWKVGTPPRETARITFHTGNDCWPDVFVEPGP